MGVQSVSVSERAPIDTDWTHASPPHVSPAGTALAALHDPSHAGGGSKSPLHGPEHVAVLEVVSEVGGPQVPDGGEQRHVSQESARAMRPETPS